MPARRFPPPWTVEELNDACFVVRDNNGQHAYVYFEEEPQRPRHDRSRVFPPSELTMMTGVSGIARKQSVSAIE
jgi:hypothetical protein